MTCFVSHTSVDCHNAYELSEWWKGLLGYGDMEGDPSLPGHEVPEAKEMKNRLHFDLRPRDVSRDEEVERLVTDGASLVTDVRGKYGPGSGWVVFADPEGNEFCVLRSEEELPELELPPGTRAGVSFSTARSSSAAKREGWPTPPTAPS